MPRSLQSKQKLFKKIKSGDADDVKNLLFDDPFLIDSVEGGYNTLMAAIRIKNKDNSMAVTELLLSLKADLVFSSTDGGRRTVLNVAISAKNEYAMQCLLERGAPFNEDSLGLSVQHSCVETALALMNLNAPLPKNINNVVALLLDNALLHKLNPEVKLFNSLLYLDRLTEALTYSIDKKNLFWVYNLLVKEGAKLDGLMSAEYQALKVLLLSGKGLDAEKLVECAIVIGDKELLKGLWYKATAAQKGQIKELIDDDFAGFELDPIAAPPPDDGLEINPFSTPIIGSGTLVSVGGE